MAFQLISSAEAPNLLNWASLMQKTSESTSDGTHPYIYKICEVDGYLETKTPVEAESFLETHRGCDVICKTLQFFDVICLSRIYLASERDANRRKLVITTLNNMAGRAEAKYNSGFMGTARKIFSYISNLFKSTGRICLFDQFKDLEIPSNTNDHLPFFVGTDATFARLVAQSYSQDSF